VAQFFQKLTQTDQKRVSILYVGDSHVQADDFTGELRNQFQQTYGFGGRGMVFPYSTARTHAAVDYVTSHTGRWLYAKNIELNPQLPLGVSGASSKTVDSNASFKLSFRGSIQPSFTRIKVFLKKDAGSYDFFIRSGNSNVRVDVFDPEKPAESNMVVVDLPGVGNDFQFSLKKSDSAQKSFEIYGISIENPEDKGVLFHSVGINGAGHYSLLRQNLMAEQLSLMAPDAVILDLGANDFYRGTLNKEEFSNNLLKIVNTIRSSAPQTCIILSCSQDIYRGGYSLPDCLIFSDVIKTFAQRNRCAFYDWYWVSGGRFSMMKWSQSGLAKWDLVHLTHPGYLLKGQLMAESYAKTALWLANIDTGIQLIFDIDSLRNPPVDTTKKEITQTPTTVRYQWVFHRVLRGQTIWSVAAWYGVSAYQIKVWNRLRSNYLWIGQVIKIYAPIKVPAPVVAPVQIPVNKRDTATKKPVITPAPVKPAPKVQVPKPTPPAPKVVYHKVKSGETLFAISRKYGSSTSAIMKFNNLRTHNIRVGQVLRVR
jgi:LysM repeat protein